MNENGAVLSIHNDIYQSMLVSYFKGILCHDNIVENFPLDLAFPGLSDEDFNCFTSSDFRRGL